MTTATTNRPSPTHLASYAPLDAAAVAVHDEGGLYGAGWIEGVAVITEGEARGHDIQIDAVTTGAILRAGEQAGDGGVLVVYRRPGDYGAPHDDAPSLERALGRLHGWRLDGASVRADLHFLDLGRRVLLDGAEVNVVARMLALARTSPRDCGLSIEAPRTTVVEDEAGRRVLRVEELRWVALVDRPAANPSGLFAEPPEGPAMLDPAAVAALVGQIADQDDPAVLALKALVDAVEPDGAAEPEETEVDLDKTCAPGPAEMAAPPLPITGQLGDADRQYAELVGRVLLLEREKTRRELVAYGRAELAKLGVVESDAYLGQLAERGRVAVEVAVEAVRRGAGRSASAAALAEKFPGTRAAPDGHGQPAEVAAYASLGPEAVALAAREARRHALAPDLYAGMPLPRHLEIQLGLKGFRLPAPAAAGNGAQKE